MPQTATPVTRGEAAREDRKDIHILKNKSIRKIYSDKLVK